MKKAKVILSLVAILAIAAGAFAFKASRSQFTGYKTTTVYYIGANSYVTTLPFCTSTTTLLSLQGIANSTLYRTTTVTAIPTRTVGNGVTTFTITAPGCTTSFTTVTTPVEG